MDSSPSALSPTCARPRDASRAPKSAAQWTEANILHMFFPVIHSIANVECTRRAGQQKDLLVGHNILWYLRRSPIEYSRAGDGIRTHDILLGKQTLCQLSYARNTQSL
jgi:hypothetical protein